MTMNIFFIGVTDFGLECYNKIRELGYKIVGCAYTGENIIVKRQQDGIKNATFVDFKLIAERHNIVGIYFDKAQPEAFTEQVRGLSPDLIVVAG